MKLPVYWWFGMSVADNWPWWDTALGEDLVEPRQVLAKVKW